MHQEYEYRMMSKISSILWIFCLLICNFSAHTQAVSVSVLYDTLDPQAAFAANEITQALQAKGHSVNLHLLSQFGNVASGSQIILSPLSNKRITKALKSHKGNPTVNLQPEGFSIRITSNDSQKIYWILGASSAGVMYGGLELAEIIQVDGLNAVSDIDRNPYMAMRGVKFNCPLDARTPSYTDVCDSAQNNIIEMWNLDFWKEYIDHLARFRYNYISLWSLHPFPSLVKLDDYPCIALDDVKRSTVQWNEYYSLSGAGFDSPEILDNLETLKKMTIDEKIDFWRTVMRYGKERNIDFYFVTWNIFTNGTYGKYGITDKIDNEITRDYFRKSVKQMFLTYPDLAGIGLTTGENMPRASTEEKEDWAYATYAQGMLDAAKELPGRKMTFIHRQHMTGAKDIAKKFKPLVDHKDIEFIFSFKYAKAHVFSSTTQVYHQGFVKDIKGLKTIWTLRNDDSYQFRWGSPDYVREFIKNIPYDVSRGFYYGSDQYVWGREFLSTEPESPRQLEIAKHWYHWLIWGRLGYNPDLSDERFIKILRNRYPQVCEIALFNAWNKSSMIYPTVTGFHWGSLDFQWYIEACKSHPDYAKTHSGFHDVNRFITLGPHKGTDYISIPDYVKTVSEGKESEGATPIEISERLHAYADQSLESLEILDPGDNKELRLTLGDIRAIANLGKYYAHKIRGSLEVALYRDNRNPRHQQKAVDELTEAAKYWMRYITIAKSQYKNPIWFNRVGRVNWDSLTEQVLNDIKIAAGVSGQ
ncbi:carbohydrate-binding family 6 protein [candidate division KSB1 bacterium]|nr:carbohydrate-binding family 6 protein [candidate division KSB1 bacterium]